MTINYKEVEGTSTSNLSDIGMNSELVPDLFGEKEILMENEKHAAELNHLKTVVANTIGWVLSDRVEKAKILCKFLPLNYVHPNSGKKEEPANIMIQKMLSITVRRCVRPMITFRIRSRCLMQNLNM